MTSSSAADEIPALRRTTKQPRPDQRLVHTIFNTYRDELRQDHRVAFSRLIMPPRTGKSVIAGNIYAEHGEHMLFLVPGITPCENIATELRAQLPEVPIGVFYGHRKELVPNGINIATYTMATKSFIDGTMPEELSSSRIVICDEGHRTMTARRLRMLRSAFQADVPRLAMTATPDYDEQRTLASFFPTLIHEMKLDEAVAAGLLASFRFYTLTAKVDASNIHLVAGDFDHAAIGKLLSWLPIFEAARLIRTDTLNRELPALICCSSRQQARDLHSYIVKHDPELGQRTGVIIHDSSPKERGELLERFSRGELTTLINVGILIESWNSPACKLLIDLAPSASRVRSLQKFTRPLTKAGDAEARIYQILPLDLPIPAFTPPDLFGASLAGRSGALLGPLPISSNVVPPLSDNSTALERLNAISVRTKIVASYSVGVPQFERDDSVSLRKLVFSSLSYDAYELRQPGYFRKFVFHHELFHGTGSQLLRYIGCNQRNGGFRAFQARLFPHADFETDFGNEFLNALDVAEATVWHGVILHAVQETETRSQEQDPEHLAATSHFRRRIDSLLRTLPPREEKVIRLRFGIGVASDHTLEEVGQEFELVRERIRGIEKKGIRRLLHPSRARHLRGFWDPESDAKRNWRSLTIDWLYSTGTSASSASSASDKHDFVLKRLNALVPLLSPFEHERHTAHGFRLRPDLMYIHWRPMPEHPDGKQRVVQLLDRVIRLARAIGASDELTQRYSRRMMYTSVKPLPEHISAQLDAAEKDIIFAQAAIDQWYRPSTTD